MGSNWMGWGVGGGAVASTALYQIWAGTKQKELGAGSMQVPTSSRLALANAPIDHKIQAQSAARLRLVGEGRADMSCARACC